MISHIWNCAVLLFPGFVNLQHVFSECCSFSSHFFCVPSEEQILCWYAAYWIIWVIKPSWKKNIWERIQKQWNLFFEKTVFSLSDLGIKRDYRAPGGPTSETVAKCAFLFFLLKLFCCFLLLRRINNMGLVLTTLHKCYCWRHKKWGARGQKSIFPIFQQMACKRWCLPFRKSSTLEGQILHVFFPITIRGLFFFFSSILF